MEVGIITRSAGLPDEIVLSIRWHQYDQDMYLDELENSWHSRQPTEFPYQTHGTALKIQNLRNIWDQGIVARLYEGLVRLVSPFASYNDFVIEVRCPEFPEFNGQVANHILESAPYRLVGTVDTYGILKTTSPEPRTIDLRELSHDRFTHTDGTIRVPTCGTFSINLSIWDLEPATGNVPGVSNALRKMIKSKSGVNIYRDNFRVWPYGERDDDWLELNQRRVNNPTLRVSNNQVIGFVGITYTANPELRDRTSREGLLENKAFADLRTLVLTTLSILETERFSQRRELLPVKPDQSKRKDDPIIRLLSRMREQSMGSIGSTDLLRELVEAYQEKVDKDKLRYKQVVRLAGVGMAAEVVTDSFSREIHNAITLLATLTGESQFGASTETQDLLQKLNDRIGRISEQLDLMNFLYRPSTRESEPIHVRGAVYDVLNLLGHRLAETKIILDDHFDLTVNINRGHLMQVLMILIDNSLTAMQDSRTLVRHIHVQIIHDLSFKGLRINDSGPGVADNVRHLVFEHHFSTRQNGRGLGLSVARDILALYSSSLDLVMGEFQLPGACFEIRFDGRRVLRNTRQKRVFQ